MQYKCDVHRKKGPTVLLTKNGTQITTLELPKRFHILGVNHHLVAGICGETAGNDGKHETNTYHKHIYMPIYTCSIYIYISYLSMYVYDILYVYTYAHTRISFQFFLASIKTNQKHTLLLYLRKPSLKMGSQSSSWKQRTSNI